jgi:hypothetical protein
MRVRTAIRFVVDLLALVMIRSRLTLVILKRIAALPHICMCCRSPESQAHCEDHVFHLLLSIGLRERAAKCNDRAVRQLRNTVCKSTLATAAWPMPIALGAAMHSKGEAH